MKFAATLFILAGTATALGQTLTPAQRMAATVIQQRPGEVVSTLKMPNSGEYEEGVLLDGMAAEWRQTADGPDFAYIQATIDRYVDKDGNIAGSGSAAHALDEVGLGRSILLLYRVTEQPKYYKAAKFLHDRLAGGSMAPAFRAEYAATFEIPEDFDGIAKPLLLAPQLQARATGRYLMALVDTLDCFPAGHPQRSALVAALVRTLAQAAALQDKQSGLWLQALDKPRAADSPPDAAGSAMLTYAITKSVRLGYFPQSFESAAKLGWKGVETGFVRTSPDGSLLLAGTANPAAVGAYLLAGSEMEQAPTEALGQGKTVMMDAWFNSQTRKNAAGHTELFHYKWDDETNNGFSFVGHAFASYGAKLAELPEAPTTANLAKARIYFIVSPDIPSKNPNPHSMDQAGGDAIEAWVRSGGVLILMMNDVHSTEFIHMNTLGERFGIHFNPVDRNLVTGNEFQMGMLKLPAIAGLFPQPLTVYMKEICTIAVSGPAKSVYVDKGDTLMAIAKVGKGTIYAVTDPWLYNEYTDGRKLPPVYQDFQAAKDLAGWAIRAAH